MSMPLSMRVVSVLCYSSRTINVDAFVHESGVCFVLL